MLIAVRPTQADKVPSKMVALCSWKAVTGEGHRAKVLSFLPDPCVRLTQSKKKILELMGRARTRKALHEDH